MHIVKREGGEYRPVSFGVGGYEKEEEKNKEKCDRKKL
jgi:hypothetical protein